MSLLVIKYGGHAMDEFDLSIAFAQSLKLLRDSGYTLVLGHGGGPHINAMLDKLNISSTFCKGMRVTDDETMRVVEMVLRGTLNSWLVSLFIEAGLPAVGISGKDNATVRARQILDLGLVGEVIHVDVSLITTLLDAGFMPVIAPIGYGEAGQSLNINADITTGAIAGALHADDFVLVTDVAGVLGMDGTLFETLTLDKIEELKEQEIITGGMIPKVDSCINALNKGCKRAYILDGRKAGNLENLLLNKAPVGTLIVKN